MSGIFLQNISFIMSEEKYYLSCEYDSYCPRWTKPPGLTEMKVVAKFIREDFCITKQRLTLRIRLEKLESYSKRYKEAEHQCQN